MKTAIVTGGTKGIGKQIVKELLHRQYFVYTNYANDSLTAEEAKFDFAKINDSFEIIKADQSKKEELYSFIGKIKDKEKKIDCIVCNAGATLRNNIVNILDSEWERVMDVVVNSHFYLIRDLYELIPHNSRIIFIGSMMGVFPHGTSLPYGVAKSALHALAKNLVKVFEGTNTTVNTIIPGFVETEWQKDKPQEIRDNIISKTAVKRFAAIDEISNAAMFCLDNAFINGAQLEINGGYCFK